MLAFTGSADDRDGERQAICEGHAGARSWNHFLETTCLADLELRGIVKTKAGYRALLQLHAAGVTETTFTAEVGSLLYDGVVEGIDDGSVTFRQTIGMPADTWRASGSDLRKTRLVERRLHAKRDGRQEE